VDVRTILRGVGKTSMAIGTLILLFVAYQLWGTGIAEARAQDRLRREFKAPLPAVAVPTATAHGSGPPGPTTTPTTTTPTTAASTTATTAVEALPPAPTGSAVAILRIPRVGVDAAVVEGVGVGDLKKGPGHYPLTPLPGQTGNAAIAGHRTTYGAPFYRLDELKPGDDIYVTTRSSPEAFHYQVEFSHDVSPSDVSVLDPSTENRLTLTTCTPRFTAQKRLVVVSHLVGAVDPRPPAPAPSSPATNLPGDTGDATATGRAALGSLSGTGTSTWPAILWGLACAAIWAGAWLIGRRWRRWVTYALATPLFLIVLFFFFENFARFVPANI